MMTPDKIRPTPHKPSYYESVQIWLRLLAGEKHHDIAATYGLNQGRVADVKDGRHYPEAQADAEARFAAGERAVRPAKRVRRLNVDELYESFRAFAVLRQEPDFVSLALDHGVKKTTIQAHHRQWVAEGGVRLSPALSLSPAAADKIAALGPDRVNMTRALSVPTGLGFEGHIPVTGYWEVPDGASRLPSQREVLTFFTMLFIILGLLLYFFTPGA